MKQQLHRSKKKSRTNTPKIFIQIGTEPACWHCKRTAIHARGSIVRRGEYQFLQWRDGETVRRFYLGKRKIK